MKKILLLLIFLFFLVCFYFYWALYLPIDTASSGVIFLVKKGESLGEISKKLKESGLIKSKLFFQLYVLLRGEQKNLKAGRYLFSKSLNAFDIAEKLIKGDMIKRKIIIVEGRTLEEIAEYLDKNSIFSKQEFLDLTKEDFSQNFDFLKDKPKNLNLEGYFFPDTYELGEENSLKDFIAKALDNFDNKIDSELKEEIKRQGKTIFEIITMASLLEKEVRSYPEKQLVSGILWKRLEMDMPLQVDATINYITGKKSVKISKKETKIDSPYNTYKYAGLPLGPICNPGLESIKAAIYPQESNYLYYLSTPDGKTIFSRSLEEHNIAKSKYLK